MGAVAGEKGVGADPQEENGDSEEDAGKWAYQSKAYQVAAKKPDGGGDYNKPDNLFNVGRQRKIFAACKE